MNGSTAPPERHSQLDGLRGLAALLVVFHHWSLVLPGVRTTLSDLYLPRLLVAGPQAVVLFFVLSGFVLFEAHERYAKRGYLRWCGWRLVRLGVPVAAAVTLSAILAALIQPQPVSGLSTWFNEESWAGPRDLSEWLRNILPLDGQRNHQLDNPCWSLVHELRIALIFPLLAVAVRRSWLVTLVATLLVAQFFSAGSPRSSFDLLWTAHYLWLFVAGAALSSHRAVLAAAFRQPRFRHLRLLFLPLSLAALASIARPAFAPPLIVCAGAVLLVATCAFEQPVAKFLRAAPFVWLGRVSFSLYVVHLPVLLAFVHLLHDRLSITAIAIVAIPVTISVAALAERCVERPAQRLGRRFLTSPARSSPRRPIFGLAPRSASANAEFEPV